VTFDYQFVDVGGVERVERLEGEVVDDEQVDAQIEALRARRVGLGRALEHEWNALDRSTSGAAYLARRGGEPELRAGEPLHVTNGDSTANTLRSTSLPGVVLAWNDVLHEGPLDTDLARMRHIRAQFLASHGWSDAAVIEAELERRDELLARAVAARHPIVLWFEHDLFDQLQLLQILASVTADADVQLVQAHTYLGALEVDALEELWGERQAVDAATRAAARSAWQAICGGRFDEARAQDLEALPYARRAIDRLEEERAPLSRTKRQLLAALGDGPKRPLELFVANQRAEEALFLGDTWFFLKLYELADEGFVAPAAGGAIPLPPPRGDYDRFVETLVEQRT
jgi:hypothetical protein